MMDFVSWYDEIPKIWKNKSHVPKHQPENPRPEIQYKKQWFGWYLLLSMIHFLASLWGCVWVCYTYGADLIFTFTQLMSRHKLITNKEVFLSNTKDTAWPSRNITIITIIQNNCKCPPTVHFIEGHSICTKDLLHPNPEVTSLVIYITIEWIVQLY